MAFERLGCDPDKTGVNDLCEFGVRAGLLPARARSRHTRTAKDSDESRKFKVWLDGTSDPRFEFLMPILDAADLLHPDVRAAWRGSQVPRTRVLPALEAPASGDEAAAGRRSRGG